MYRISFYGDRKPETIPDARGKLIYEDYQKGEMPPRVEIRAGLTIEAKSIKEIEHIPDSARYPQGPTEAELKLFEVSQLKGFLNERGELTPQDELAFLVAKGLIRVEMHKETYKTASDATLYVQSHKVREFGEVTELLSAWKTMKGKKNYAEKKELEELQAIADQSV